MNPTFTVLVVEDDPKTTAAFADLVRRVGEPVLAGTVAEARRALTSEVAWGAFLIDFKLPDGSGLDVLRDARTRYPRVPGCVVSGWFFPEILDTANTVGASYILKNDGKTENIERFLRLATEQLAATPDRLDITVREWSDRFLRKAPVLGEILHAHL
jgi:DNA-binding NtrC family response regulator